MADWASSAVTNVVLAKRFEEVFTRQERLALGFLIMLGFGGLLLLAWQRAHPPSPPPFVRLSVRVNVASASELAALPGIGPRMAQRIVEDRQRHGRYLTLTDLRRVKGVAPKTLERLRGSVHFD